MVRHLTEDHKRKISDAQKGKPRLYAIGNTYNRGRIPWNKGLMMSEEFKKNMNMDGLKLGQYGSYPCSQETREKMSESHVGKKRAKEVIRKCLMRRAMSGIENKVLQIIKKYKLPYKFVGDGKFFIERINPDFVNTNGEKIAVEVYWKRHKEEFRDGGVRRWVFDRLRICSKYGWEVIFIEATNLTEQKVLNVLKKGGGYHR